MDIYTKEVGRKFYADGSPKKFQGATIISPIGSDEPVYQLVSGIAQEAKNSSYARKSVFLPPESYHMTNISLYNDAQEFRDSSLWSYKYSRDIPTEQLNKSLAKDIASINSPESFLMEPYFVEKNSLKLKPATSQCAEKLQQFFRDVSAVTGIRWLDFEAYLFHISYAYRLIELSDEEKEEEKHLLERQTEWITRELAEIPIAKGVFCTFEDMFHFEPYFL